MPKKIEHVKIQLGRKGECNVENPRSTVGKCYTHGVIFNTGNFLARKEVPLPPRQGR